jgi:hypothetical protein
MRNLHVPFLKRSLLSGFDCRQIPLRYSTTHFGGLLKFGLGWLVTCFEHRRNGAIHGQDLMESAIQPMNPAAMSGTEAATVLQ